MKSIIYSIFATVLILMRVNFIMYPIRNTYHVVESVPFYLQLLIYFILDHNVINILVLDVTEDQTARGYLYNNVVLPW